MNYWLLTTEYPPFFGGGISTYCYHTARMLAAQGIRVTVFLPDPQEKDYAIAEESPARVVRFNPHRTGVDTFLGHAPRLSYEFAQIVKDIVLLEGKPDVIESQDYLAISYYLLQFKHLKYPEFSDIPVVVTLHSPAFLYLHYNREETYRYPNYWTGEMEWSCIRSADHLISPSAYLLEAMTPFGEVPRERTTVIRNPYEVKEAPPASTASGELLFYGKLSPQKGIFELLDGMRRLWEDGFSQGLTLIGGSDKVYYPEMKTMGQVVGDKYAAYINRGLLRIEGKVAPKDRDARLSSARLVIIPSIVDNLPYAAIEAMSIGKVVLASVQGGQGEIIRDGETGFVFDHLEPGSLERQMKRIDALDTSSLERIGAQASVSILEECSYERVFAQKMDLIRRLAGTSSGDVFPFIREIAPSAKAQPSTAFAPRVPLEVSGLMDPKASSAPLTPLHPAEPGLLSVVIPFYNMGAYIDECVSSVLNSAWTPLEVLVIDDGSTEAVSQEALRRLEADPRIRVLRKPNAGLAETRNYGAIHARGVYLAFLDADDCVGREYYSKAIRVLSAYRNVSFAGCWVQYFEGSDHVWPTWNPEPPYILLHNTLNSSALVYKREAFLEAGRNDPALEYGLEDYDSVISLLASGHRGVTLPERLFRYRVRKGSMFRRLTLHKILYSQQHIAARHAGLYGQYAVQLFDLLNANGPSHAYDNPSLEVRVSSKVAGAGDLKNRIKDIARRNPALKGVLLRLKIILKQA